MSEQRINKRLHLIYYLRVFDKKNNTLLGHLVDITTGGFMLLSENPIKTGIEFALSMDVPLPEGLTERVELNAKSCWSNQDANPAFYDTGFQFLDTSSQLRGRLQVMIDDLKF